MAVSKKSGSTKATPPDSPLLGTHVSEPPMHDGVADIAKFKQAILRHLTYTLARDIGTARPRDWWIAMAMAVREQILARLISTQGVHNDNNVRRLYYFSLEYLMGRLMENNLYNTGYFDAAVAALGELGVDFNLIREQEVDMGLGNGGLGRLAACFLD